MEDKKTISYLKSKTWYRFYEVVALTAFFIMFLIINISIFGYGLNYVNWTKFIFLNLLLLIIFKIIEYAVFYTTLGTIKPKE